MDVVQVYRESLKFYQRKQIPLSPAHKRYLKQARKELVRLFPTAQQQLDLKPYAGLIRGLFLLDLEPLRPVLTPLYSDKPRGTPPRDPVQMLRACLCMTLSGETSSFTKWVGQLRTQPLFAVLSGFDARPPGIGTFYDFTARLWPETTAPQTRKPVRRPKDAAAATVKKKTPRTGATARFVKAAQARLEQPLAAFPALRLNLLLKPVVLRSHELGLLSASARITLAGDGSKFTTGARAVGRKLCDCRKKGVFRCDCPRLYTDRFASWGWDSYRERYVYGHALYELTAASSPHDLPVCLLLAQAKDHDSLLGVKALERVYKLYPELDFEAFLGDSAHDNYPTYGFCETLGLQAFIALNERQTGQYQLPHEFTANALGTPVCPQGETMQANGFCPDRCRFKWRCPRAVWGQTPACACSTSDYGRVFYTKPADDSRLFTQPPRDSPAWREAYRARTSVERSHKRKKLDFKLEQARVRSRRQWAVRLFVMALCQHAAAWVELLQTTGA